MTTLWPAPLAKGAISGVLPVPGSKSVTNRALVLAVQSPDESLLESPLHSRDTELMATALTALGFSITNEANGDWRVQKSTRVVDEVRIDVGNAGTVMRFLPPVAVLVPGTFHFDGDARSHERPLGPVISALRELGAEIHDDNRGSLPFTLVSDGTLRGGIVEIDASASSQFVSALLLVGASTELGIRVRHIGASLPSLPHIEMTIKMLRKSGVAVDVVGTAEWFVAPGKVNAQNYVIEPDLSNAAPFLAAALVTGGDVTIKDWPSDTTQPGDQLRSIFAKMGGDISFTEVGLRLRGGVSVSGIDIDLHDVGELTPIIAAVAALASTPSHLRGIGHLRLHETDRLTALAHELNALGGDVIEHPTSLEIRPAALHGGTFHTYEDHRLATAGAVLGLIVPEIQVENMETVGKTMPTFPTLWQELVSGS
ncbi:MAG: 3-phosphoshikimate 1-carboxyvinyltransferase [Actinobacteria bacterium]|nr:3-phosphoshikimate 1-carboxyvinyltransferase [Actinomycetota bacterium]MSY86879.1 3-phosphoshikimate 1-carboxyvinyltransferase [Actinomycetota bacterium]